MTPIRWRVQFHQAIITGKKVRRHADVSFALIKTLQDNEFVECTRIDIGVGLKHGLRQWRRMAEYLVNELFQVLVPALHMNLDQADPIPYPTA